MKDSNKYAYCMNIDVLFTESAKKNCKSTPELIYYTTIIQAILLEFYKKAYDV